MAEFLIRPLVSMVMNKASSYLLDQYKVMEGMEKQRKILERKLPAILDVIQDAEEKGAYRPGVRAWLDALTAVSYEAIAVFDEFKYEALWREAKKKGRYNKLGMDLVSGLFPAHNPIAFRHRMGKKLQEIVETIEVLVTEMNAFRFNHLQQPSKQWRQTDSIMPDSEQDIVSRSRNNEKTRIVNMLLDQASNKDLLVLPIVGMGGLGKTTFAQMVYNDPVIEKHFELRKWCCVSDDFDAANIASNICQTNEKNREKALQDLLKEVSGKRYLIVLDDVWNEDAVKWEKLKSCLKQGGQGSAILTTTRKAKVAEIMKMGVDGGYHLEKLDKVFMKEIFENRAFSLHKPNTHELNDMVEKMLDRCAGSPLAAKAFGSMLSTKTSMEEWRVTLTKSSICNEETGILPILKLSYDDLPSHMKRCFAFCAIFPKDYEIEVETLIQLWMAHDFISSQDDDHPETVGEDIFKELVWRSFFQDVNQHSPIVHAERIQLRHIRKCKIHDLMHDIALSVMGKECVTIVDRPNQKSLHSGPIRHLLLSYRNTGTLLDDFLKKQSPTLQTVLYTDRYTDGSPPQISKYNSIRALQLFRRSKLPLRPRYLQHLRYLNLSYNMQIKALPEEISILYNLQTLNVSQCERLVRLPKDMRYMTSLRHLYTNGCKSLKCMPPDLGKLSSLQTLTYFVVAASVGYSTLGELQNLKLSGELSLRGLENVTVADAKAARLGSKDNLAHLSLEWSGSKYEDPVSDIHKKVLDALKPHSGLQMLRMVSYRSAGLPTWMTDLSVLSHLTELHLVDCSCVEFPQLGHLTALEVLYLKGLDKLQSLCSETAFAAFPALRELALYDLKTLDKWSANIGEAEEEITFHLLEKVTISDCPKLTTLPEAPKIKFLWLGEENAHLSLSVVQSRYMCSLSELKLFVKNKEITTTMQLDQDRESSVSELIISGCEYFFPSNPAQPIVGIWKWFGQLVDLSIYSCDALSHWPEEEFRSLESLKYLSIEECNNLIGPLPLKENPTQGNGQLLPHLSILGILSCESLTDLFVLPQSLRNIVLVDCPKLNFILEEDTVTSSEQHSEHCASTNMPVQSPLGRNHSLPCLEFLTIYGLNAVVALQYLPPSLNGLWITECHKLRSISGNLGALEILSIRACKKLDTLDGLGGLPSLKSLTITRCKRLQSLPGGLGSYSHFQSLEISYCPAINMKGLNANLKQRSDDLEDVDTSCAHSSDPWEGPKLKVPKSWKYAIPGCGYWGSGRLKFQNEILKEFHL